MDIMTPLQAELLRAAGAMLTKQEFDHLLYIGDLPLPDDLIKAKSVARKKLVQAVASDAQQQFVEAMGIETLAIPTYDIARHERLKIALVAGIAKGLFRDGEVVLGLVGRGPTSYPDALMIVTIGGDDEDAVDTGFGVVGTDRIPSTILESVIDVAIDIARDGWEGHPLGTILVVGDTTAVLEKSRQLTLNPFQGYSEAEKNILNPEVRDAIKNFAVLDGAFVIREDGVVLAAGRYLKFDDEIEVTVPLGLGARHMAAAGISQVTEAIAIVVSETSGVARVFQGGKCVLEIAAEQRARRGGGDDDEEPVVLEEVPLQEDADGEPKPKESKPKEPKPKEPKPKEAKPKGTKLRKTDTKGASKTTGARSAKASKKSS